MILEKIKDLYSCSEINQEQLYPLQKWFNEVINKNYDELNLCDVLKMLRQKMFLELAVNKAIYFLLDDPFVGELYEGQLFETLTELEYNFHTEDIARLKEIVSNAKSLTNYHNWTYESESDEFLRIVYKMNMKLHHYSQV